LQQKWGTQKGKNMTIKMKFSRNNKVFPTDHVAVFLWPKGNGDFSNPMLKHACVHARFTVVDKKATPLFLEEDVLVEKKTYVVTEQETWEDIFTRIKKDKFK
jgi:hypothetical protein